MPDLEKTPHVARTAFQVAGQLRILRELIDDAGWKPDGYTGDDLSELASALHGMAIRCAMHTKDSDLPHPPDAGASSSA